MSYTFLLNSTNVLNSSNLNIYEYQFINGSFKVNDKMEMMIGSINIPYSWYNVSSTYANQSFQINWPLTSSTYTQYSITLPTGYYDVTSLNSYIENYCVSNGLYLINSSGNYVYYIQLVYNTTYYAVQLLTFLVPTSLPSGYTQPSNFVGYPSSTATMSLTIPSTSNFGDIIGFSSGTYGFSSSSNQSVFSNITPNGTNVNSIVMTCNLVDNYITNTTTIVDAMPINADFGSNISYSPTIEKWIRLKKGSYQSLIFTFLDQNLDSLPMTDSNVLITLIIREKK